MKRLSLFCAASGVLLGSAAPPLPAIAPSAEPQPPSHEILIPAPPPTVVLPAIKPEPTAAPKPPRRAAVRRKTAPGPSQAPGVRIVVGLAEQRAYVFEGGRLIATSPVSTGKRGHETPVGTFRILQKKVHHRSSKYGNAPMPYMQRLTDYGIALHAGSLPGYPASHGCIRLPRGFAKKLYAMTDHGTTVTVVRRGGKRHSAAA